MADDHVRRAPDTARLLHRNPARPGYAEGPVTDAGPRVYRALTDEPEAIDEETQRMQSTEASRRWSVVKAAEIARKESRSRCERLRKVAQRAFDRNIDIHRHLSQIDREIAQAEDLVG